MAPSVDRKDKHWHPSAKLRHRLTANPLIWKQTEYALHMTPLAALRLLALTVLLFSIGALIANIAQTWDTFNPSYWGHYVQQQLARPLIGLVFSALVLFGARPLARWLARD